MLSFILFRVVLFLVPFVLYWAFWRFIRRQSAEGRPVMPYLRLALCGMLLVVASFLLARFQHADSIEGTYVPPHVEDGKIIPGHMER